MAIIYTNPTVSPTTLDKILISVNGTNKTANATVDGVKEALDVVDTFSNTFGNYIGGTVNTNATR